MAIDSIHKALIVNISGIEPADMHLIVPKSLLDIPTGEDGQQTEFIPYVDGQRVTNEGCDTGYNKPLICWDNHPQDLGSATSFFLAVNYPGTHSISIIGTQVAPELPFSNAIMLVTVVGFLGIIIILTRVKPRDLQRYHA